MKSGTENRKKIIIAGSLGAVALGCVIYLLITQFGGPSDSAPPPPKPANATAKAEQDIAVSSAKPAQNNGAPGTGAIPGVDARKIADTSSSLDPTLDESAMLRTESLVYSGSGRNIFSLGSAPPPPPPPMPPKKLPDPRHQPDPGPSLPPLPQTCPPNCPPIPLKFFGTAQHGNGPRQAFLLQGDDVYLASEGDIVAHKYKIRSIAASFLQVEDLSNGNTQMLSLQQ